MAKVIEEVRLSCTDLKNGKQKLYWMDLQDDGMVRVRYGRTVEVAGEIKFAHDDLVKGGKAFLDKQKRDKMRSGRSSGTYIEQPILKGVQNVEAASPVGNIETIALEQIITTSPEVRNLIKYLAQANIHKITSNSKIQYNSTTGLFTTAFGLITKDGINQARTYLSNIKTSMESGNLGSDFESAIDGYLNIIPRNLPRQKASYSDVFGSIDEVLKQNDILDALESSLVEATKPKPKADGSVEEIEKIFDVRLDLVTDPTELSRVERYYNSTAKDMHQFARGYKVSKVYKVELNPMKKAFEERGVSKGEIKELWHGTSASNILSILKSGLQISPPATAHIAGKAFGNGIYFALHSTKSMGYATSFWGGSGAGNKAFMFLNDVALGKWYVPRSSVSEPPPKGFDTYWAKPTETRKFGGYLENDEIIVFDPAQINPVYLVEFEK